MSRAPESTTQRKAALRRACRARQDYLDARDVWEQSVRDAIEAGASYRQVLTATGVRSLSQLTIITRRYRARDAAVGG